MMGKDFSQLHMYLLSYICTYILTSLPLSPTSPEIKKFKMYKLEILGRRGWGRGAS